MKPLQRVMMKAAEQHGAVSVEQMRECALSWRAQRTAIANGQLIMVEPTVAVVVGSPDTWYRRLQVGLLALGSEAWVSHEAAAALLGLDKALFELAELRGPGRHGVRVLDGLMPDTGGETPLERAFRRVLRRNGRPRPTTQHRVAGPNGFIGRVDFIYDGLSVVIEVTGRKGHASDAERQRDAQRRNELLDQGLKVYEYTRSDVEDRPEWVATTMGERLIAAGWAAPALASRQIAPKRDLG